MKENMNKLLNAIKRQTEWTEILDSLNDMKAPSGNVIAAAHDELEKAGEEVISILWDMFTDWAGITDAQHNDYNKFDEVYNSFEETGYIKWLVITEDYDIKFLNPIPIKFLETLKEIEGLTVVNIDTQLNAVTIW